MKGAVGTRGRVTSLSESLLPPIRVGGKGGFSETGESEEEKENVLMPFGSLPFSLSSPGICLHLFAYRELGPSVSEEGEARLY